MQSSDEEEPEPAEELKVVGRKVMRGATQIGILSIPSHWTPPSYALQCTHRLHGNQCRVHAPIVAGSLNALVQWCSEQDRWGNAEGHKENRPAETHRQDQRARRR